MSQMLDRVDVRALGVVGGTIGAAYLYATKEDTKNGYSREIAALVGSSIIGAALVYGNVMDNKPLIVGVSAFGGVLGGSTTDYYLNKIEDSIGM